MSDDDDDDDDRVELQQRECAHIHGLFWIKEAPQYQKSPNEEIVSFVDKYITCQKPDSSSEMEDLVNLQTHRHTKTCNKEGHKISRFNFPLPPMPRTLILTPALMQKSRERQNKLLKNESGSW